MPHEMSPTTIESPRPAAAETVVVCMPAHRDARLTRAFLTEAGLCADVDVTPEGLSERLRTSEVGVLVLTEEALAGGRHESLKAALARQPAWSELPVLLLVCADHAPHYAIQVREIFGASANVTVLERPLNPATLVTAVRSALQARRRQYEVRDLLGALDEANFALERQVAIRTAALQRKTLETRRLAGRLTIAEQQERRRVGQLLHDDLQQLLFGVQLQLSTTLTGTPSPDRLVEAVTTAAAWLTEAIDMTRRLTVDLSPPHLKGEGLTEALEWLAEQMEEVHGLRVSLQADTPALLPDDGARIFLFQIIRELLFNVVKHAGVNAATVRVQERDGHLAVDVEDEGAGFDPETRGRGTGFGLSGVHERMSLFGGTVAVRSAPGAGTRVSLTLPAAASHAESPEEHAAA